MSAVSAGHPQVRADPPRALSVAFSLSAFFLPMGIVGTVGLLATRLWPQQEHRRALVALACFGLALALMLAPAILPGTRATATFSLVSAALGIGILAWNHTRSRALLLGGAALLALRFPAFGLVDAAYVRASGDLAWAPALWWAVGAFAIGAAGSLCLALALAWRVKPMRQDPDSKWPENVA